MKGLREEGPARFSGLWQRDAPEQTAAQMGGPEGMVAQAYGVAAGAGVLADYLVRDGGDLGERDADDRGPDRVGVVCNLTAEARNSRGNGGNHLAGFGADAGDAPITLIQGPDRAVAGGEEARIWTDRNGRQDLAASRVYRGENAGLISGDPHDAVAVDRVEGAWRDGDFLADGVGGGIDAQERAVGVGDDPEGVFAGGDAAFVVGGADGERGGDFVGSGIDTGEARGLAAEGNPEGIECEC